MARPAPSSWSDLAVLLACGGGTGGDDDDDEAGDEQEQAETCDGVVGEVVRPNTRLIDLCGLISQEEGLEVPLSPALPVSPDDLDVAAHETSSEERCETAPTPHDERRPADVGPDRKDDPASASESTMPTLDSLPATGDDADEHPLSPVLEQPRHGDRPALPHPALLGSPPMLQGDRSDEDTVDNDDITPDRDESQVFDFAGAPIARWRSRVPLVNDESQVFEFESFTAPNRDRDPLDATRQRHGNTGDPRPVPAQIQIRPAEAEHLSDDDVVESGPLSPAIISSSLPDDIVNTPPPPRPPAVESAGDPLTVSPTYADRFDLERFKPANRERNSPASSTKENVAPASGTTRSERVSARRPGEQSSLKSAPRVPRWHHRRPPVKRYRQTTLI
ncbi:Uncharacterized protein PBTT_09913 [Plasmodiophora brassicae]